MTELYTPDEAEMYFLDFYYSLFQPDNNDLRETTSFILRNKDRFVDKYKDDMIHISEFQIETFGEDTEYVGLLKGFVKELKD